MQWFIERSPLTHATNITTPLLIIHSENDLRCPMEQAEQMFTVLKKLRRDVLFIRFPDETHEMSRAGRPRHRRDRFKYILDWFDAWLAHPVPEPIANLQARWSAPDAPTQAAPAPKRDGAGATPGRTAEQAAARPD
jgi:hypothetical protein